MFVCVGVGVCVGVWGCVCKQQYLITQYFETYRKGFSPLTGVPGPPLCPGNPRLPGGPYEDRHG